MHMATLRWGTVVCGIVLCTSFVAAENWPRFRGPNGEGIARDTGVPVEWTADNGVLWKTVLPGVGHSSPIVWGDRIFVQSATASERMLLCLRAGDGKILWTHTVTGTKAHTHDKNTLASSTPAADGKHVYAVFWDGEGLDLCALDFEGKPVWKRALGSFKSQHGAGLSPMVVEDRVIVADDQDGSAVLLAFGARDGKPLWEAPRRPFRACYSTPFLLERRGQPAELIVGSTAGLTSYDPRSGKENWNWEWKFDAMALRTVASPVYANGFIVANSGDGSGARHAVAVQINGAGKSAKPVLAWENKKKREFPYVPSMLAWGDYVYYVADNGVAACLELKTGKQVWRKRLDSDMTASPVLIDGKIYAVSEAGDVHVFAAAPTFVPLGSSSVGEQVSATPAVADNRLYIRGDTHLFCIGKRAEK
jgi:outer membrane protein assembly factor BamB